MGKHRLMTHTDLDGVGCAIIMNYYDKDVEVVFCSNRSVESKLIDFLESEHLSQYSKLTITDVPLTEELANRLDQLKGLEVRLIDHHQTQLGFNRYDWAKVVVETEEKAECATHLLLKELMQTTDKEIPEVYQTFTEYVRLYDTWEWEEEGCILAKKMNHILGFQGLERFYEKMVNKLPQDILLTEEEEEILQILEESQTRYIKRKSKQLIRTQAHGYKIGLVFGEQYISELGHALAEEHKDLDLIAIYTGERVSLRTIKKEINLGEWSKEHYGGGGHQGAAGMSVVEEKIKRISETIFE